MESISLDGGNGRMKDDFSDIFRGSFTIEAMISVDSRREVRNVLRWQVYPESETILPTFICIFTISSRDFEGPSVDRETEVMPPKANIAPP